MLNTNKHHSKSRAYSRQSDTPIEQNLPTQRHVRTDPRTAITLIAASLRSLTLTAGKPGTSRESARQPAQPKAVWPHQSMHQHSRVIWKQESRTKSHRPHTGTQPKTSGRTSGRGEQLYPENSESSEALIERPRLRGVWQDKARFLSARTASLQPARTTGVNRAVYPNNPVVRSQTVSEAKHKLAPVTLWVDQPVRAHLESIARKEDLTISAAGAAFLRKSLQQDIDLDYTATLEPVFERLFAKHMRGIATHLSWILVRVSIDCGQTRSLVTNILGRQPGMSTDLLRSIVKQSGETARGNITRRTPQLEDVVLSVERWLLTEEKPKTGDRGGNH